MMEGADLFNSWCYNLSDGFLNSPHSKPQKNDFTPRYYQIELASSVFHSNKILFLPAEQDKLHVAFLLTKYFIGDLRRTGKFFIYFVDSIERGYRVSTFLKQYTKYDVPLLRGGNGQFSGSKDPANHPFLIYYYDVQDSLSMMETVEKMFQNTLVGVFDDCMHIMGDHSLEKVLKIFLKINDKQNLRIIGLTSALIHSDMKIENLQNDCVFKYLIHMEKSLKSTIISSSYCDAVKKYLTNTKIKLVKYDGSSKDWIPNNIAEKIDRLLDYLYILIDKPNYHEEEKFIRNRLKFILDDFKKVYRNHGLFSIYVTACLSRISLEKLKLFCSDDAHFLIVSAIISDFSAISSLLKSVIEVSGDMEDASVIKDSCEIKMVKLWSILSKMDVEKNCIIFVRDSVIAQAISYIFQKLSSLESKMLSVECITTDYLNFNSITKRDEILLKKMLRKVLKKFFQRSINVLILTWDTLNNIMNINADWIFYYDLPPSITSYVISQRYGNCLQNEHYFLVEERSHQQMRQEIEPFAKVNLILSEVLQKKNIINVECLKKIFSVTQMSQEKLEKNYPFLISSSEKKVNLSTAINLVNRFCESLPTDAFSRVAPRWTIEKNENIIFKLQLPFEPSINFIVESAPVMNMEVTKQVAAIETVKKLKEQNYLNDQMAPMVDDIDFSLSDQKLLFPHWLDTDFYGAGTSNCCRIVPITYSKWLYDCAPRPGEDSYVHVIHLHPSYEIPDAPRKRFFHDLLMSQQEFGIVTNKKLPDICQFPVFNDLGQVDVSMKMNVSVMQFTNEQIEKMFSFHRFIFLDVLQVVKQFLVSDPDEKENSYRVVPLIVDSDKTIKIAWDIIDNAYLEDIVKPSDEERANIDYVNKSYLGKIITPWYRILPQRNYVVTKVLEDSSPNDPFSSDEHSSFTTYYSDKYGIDVKQPVQPLLEARAITMNLNCVQPRAKTPSVLRKRGEKEMDFDEILIPEFCVMQPFPATYWYKSVTLLAITHRLHYILLAETIRQDVAASVENSSLKSLPSAEEDELKVDSDCVSELEESSKMVVPVASILKNIKLAKKNRSYPWGDELLPVDIDRNLDKTCLLELMIHHDFIRKLDIPIFRPAYDKDYYRKITVKSLKSYPTFLELKQELTPGPKLSDIYQALTITKCGDIVNLKTFNIIGRSFLKFAATLSLFRLYPNLNVLQLKRLCDKLIGKRNLLYCGSKLKLASCLKVHEVSDDNDWNFGGFSIPQVLVNVITESGIPPEVVFNLEIPRREQVSGTISEETRHDLHERTLNYYYKSTDESADFLNKETLPANDNNNHILIYFKKKCVPDKDVVDVLRALTGVYLMNCGVESTFKFLQFVDVVKRDIRLNKLFDSTSTTNTEDNAINIQSLYEQIFVKREIESRPLLVQAFTHHSCFPDSSSDSNQKLAFLGNSLLDLLITCYIYENRGPYMSISDLEDVRIALVNDVLFAIILIRTELHKHLIVQSPTLIEKIDEFVTRQRRVEHRIDKNEFLFLVEETSNLITETVDAPKFLSDTFKALMAAIFLETGDLRSVWNVCYNLMQYEIKEFMHDPPKNPVKLLDETDLTVEYNKPKCHRFDPTSKVVQLNVNIDNTNQSFIGVGENKQQAKIIAAKLALRDLSKHFTL